MGAPTATYAYEVSIALVDGNAEGYVVDSSSEKLRNYLEGSFALGAAVVGPLLKVLADTCGHVAVLKTLHVEEVARGQGVGTALMAEFFERIDGSQALLLQADVHEEQAPGFDLRKFYEAYDCEQVLDTVTGPLMVYPPEIAQALREGLTMTEKDKPMPMAMDSYDRSRDTALMGDFLLRHGPKVAGSGGPGAPLRFCVGSRKWVDCPNGVSDAMQVLRQQIQQVHDSGTMYRDLDEDWGAIADEAGEITHRALPNGSSGVIYEVTYLGRSSGPLQSGPLTIEEADIAPRPTMQRHRS